jgi:hypothetical protein
MKLHLLSSLSCLGLLFLASIQFWVLLETEQWLEPRKSMNGKEKTTPLGRKNKEHFEQHLDADDIFALKCCPT